MDVGILGPTEVRRHGRPVRFPGRLATKLVILLAAEAGTVVPLSLLETSLWDDPPDTARRQVQNTVSILRQAVGGETVETVGDGYRLHADRVDALEFGDAVQRARRTTDPHQAIERLTEALGRWRGRALADQSGRAFIALANRLEESRLTATELLAEREIEVERPQPAADRLHRILHAQPHRQKTAGLLMLALYRDGRTPEALQVYESLRTRLADDLGLDPDPQLRDRHAAILRGGQSRPPAPPTAPVSTATAAAIPAQLPPRPGRFVGRADLLANLDEVLANDDQGRSCVISGPAGAGKTALAIHWGHRMRRRFPDGQLFVNLRGYDSIHAVDAEHALGTLIRSLQPTGAPVPSDMDEVTALYRSLLHGKRLLVVLDNARGEAQVRRLLPPGGGSFALVTSRRRLPGLTAVDDSTPVDLPLMSSAEAVELLARTVGPVRVEVDPGAVERLARLCGGLPLALRIAAAGLATEPRASVSEYADRLAAADRLQALTIDGDPDATVTTALDQVFDSLDGTTRTVFCQLGVLPGDDLSVEVMLAVSGLPEPDTRRALDQLDIAYLVQRHSDRLQLHDLVKLYAAETARNTLAADLIGDTVDRFIEWHHARESASLPAEDNNIIVACETLKDHPRLWRLAMPLQRAINGGRSLQRVLAIVRQAKANAEADDDPAGRFHMTRYLAGAHWAADTYDLAVSLGREAVALAEHLDEEALGVAKTNLGMYLYSGGRFLDAEAMLAESIGHWNAHTDEKRAIGPLLNLCNVNTQLGRYARATEVLDRAQLLCPDSGDSDLAVYIKDYRARILFDTGRHEDALAEVADFLAMAKRLNLTRFEFNGLKLRGELHRALGDLDAARADLNGALEIVQANNSHSSVVTVLGELAEAAGGLGDHREAEMLLDSAIARSRLQSGRNTQAEAFFNLSKCVVYRGCGHHDKAVDAGTKAVETFAVTPRPLSHARALVAVAEAKRASGDESAAVADLRRAHDILVELGVPEAADVHRRLEVASG
ncbi:DNA-binding SARP family transcriptional activator [Stackebrandtia endophytica]|uniref:DNA-binding SARP family transcriptional activator n=1 Tax=Stackebrandtia endophytica TaxID=1496996 RepID=A0A543B2G5_9ACTN|nr:BTAD domain-containing putative transcriptional regulator [Stackebrandtia endophytica]TQL79039.1 DNA-binding SARP family transcriptional activator [Stackebrandtia endophytica]